MSAYSYAAQFSGSKYAHIATNATTVVKSGPGLLSGIVINNPGATMTATVYDNTAGSGTVIAVIAVPAAASVLTYGVAFATGLTIVTTGGTPADLTVLFS